MDKLIPFITLACTIFLAIASTMLKMAWDDIRDIRATLNNHITDYSVHHRQIA